MREVTWAYLELHNINWGSTAFLCHCVPILSLAGYSSASDDGKMYRTVPRMAGYVFHLQFLLAPVQFQWLRGDCTFACAAPLLNWWISTQLELDILFNIADFWFLAIGSSSARTASLTTSVCSSATMASVNGIRSVDRKSTWIVIEWCSMSNMECNDIQTSRSKMLVYPYLISLYGLGAGESALIFIS